MGWGLPKLPGFERLTDGDSGSSSAVLTDEVSKRWVGEGLPAVAESPQPPSPPVPRYCLHSMLPGSVSQACNAASAAPQL